MSRTRKFRRPANGNGSNGTATNGTNNTANRTIHIPEVVDSTNSPNIPAGQLTLRESGHFPSLRTRLLDGLNNHKTRQEDAVDRILKVSAAETEYLEGRAGQQEQQYKETLKMHEKLGV